MAQVKIVGEGMDARLQLPDGRFLDEIVPVAGIRVEYRARQTPEIEIVLAPDSIVWDLLVTAKLENVVRELREIESTEIENPSRRF